MINPHRIEVVINRKKYVSGVLDITPKAFTNREVQMILGEDFKAWVAQNRFDAASKWDIKYVKEEVPNYELG